ncbi:MAG: 3-hydroxyacyl-[acyl-carrier-protein] dehydratase FabZ [Alphaproteobacteria bacterium]|nr:3-hydroxyacyl-[acyl-carrier-protein] dehydratase FabZ [Alphaproteobacteria bacterium]
METKTQTPANPTLSIERIMEMIPHRYPFLMLDRIIDMKLGEHATGLKNVTINEPFFTGHFPGKPVMPGVLIIEAMAQTCAVLVVNTMGKEAEGKLVYFMSIEEAKFRKPVGPGDSLHIRVDKQQARRNVWKFACVATVEGVKVAEAVVCAMIVA